MKRIIYLLVIISTYSCSTTRTLNVQKIEEGTRITTYKDDGELVRTYSLLVYKAKKDAKVTVKVEENKILITPFNLKDDFLQIGDTLKTNVDFVNDLVGYKIADKYAFAPKLTGKKLMVLGKCKLDTGNLFYTKETPIEEAKDFVETKKIKYFHNKPVLQTLTIPFKFRRKNKNVSNNLSTNFNAGIAYGYQWNSTTLSPIYYVEDKEKVKMSGYDKRTLSFSLSPFAGLTAISLKPSNTENKITDEKSVLGMSFGAAGVFSFNRVNVGLALGFDYGLNDSKNWVHQGELWTGIVLGLDLIK